MHAQEPLALVAVEGRPPQTGVGEERLHACGEIAGGQPADVLLIEPVELVLTEDGVAAADALERERGDELVAREELLIVAGRPAEEREEVDHRFGKIAEALVLHHRGGAVTLAQPLLVRAEDERHVREARRRLAECLVEQNLLGRIRDVVVATDNIRDGHVDVVCDNREVVGRVPIGAQHDEVFDVGVVERDRSAHAVVEACLPVRAP